MHRVPLCLALACHLALALIASRPAAADSYTVTDLGLLPGTANSWVWQQTINNDGVVAVYANSIADPNAFTGDSSYLWQNGQITPLPGLPGATDTIAFALNNHGQVVGRSTVPGAPNHPVLWDQGVIQMLDELPGDNKGAALGINDHGQVVGYSASTATGIRTAVIWYKGTLSQLPSLPGGGGFDEALGINEKGQIVGLSGPGGGLDHITLWDHGVAIDLGTLGGDFGEAVAINNKGEICGTSTTAIGGPDPFLWEDGVITDLGVLAGDVDGVAYDINNRGQVVGYSESNPSDLTTGHALLWENGGMISLQTMISTDSGWTLLQALGINNRGQIVGFGIHDGQYRAFLLTPVG